MNKKKVGFALALPFLTLSLTGASVPDSDILQVGNENWSKTVGFYFKEMAVPPHGKGDLPYEYTLISRRAGKLKIAVRFYYTYDKYDPKQVEGYYRDEWVFRTTVWEPKKAGEEFTVKGTWKLNYKWEQRHFIRSLISVHIDGLPSSQNLVTQYVKYSKTFLNEITPKDFPWTRKYDPIFDSVNAGYYTGWRLGGPENHIYKTRFIIDGKGFQDEFVDPQFGVFPSDYYFLGKGYFGEYAKVDWKKGELRIYSKNILAFDAGSLRYDKDRKEYYRSFEVVPEFDGRRTKIAFKKKMYVSSDLTDCTDKLKSNRKYYETKKLFLPQNVDARAQTYECSLRLTDFGESLSDTFTYNFNVTKNYNYFGPSSFSEYSILEVL